MDQQKLEASIKLIRGLPTSKLEQNINAITNLIYDEDEVLNAFLQKIDNPLLICKDDILGEFIKCEYNREGDSYRSPYSNQFYPPLEDGKVTSNELRELEIKLNKIFSIYAKSYYSPSTIISCYVWELGHKIEDGFAVAILVKNSVSLAKEVESGIWDSSNFITVNFNKTGENGIEAVYKLTTTIMLQMSFNHKICGKVNLAGSMTKQFIQKNEIKSYIDESQHVENIGNLVEDMENNMRNIIEEVYIKKSKEVIIY
jgi:capping protein beta